MFPSINYDRDYGEQSEETDESSEMTSAGEIRQLTVALPYSDVTIQCLASMLYCKSNGLWDSSESGLTVDTDYLSSVATNYVVTNVGCGSTGASVETASSWQYEDERPDLFLARDSKAVWQAGLAEGLNSYLSDNQYLSGRQIYADALTCNSDDGVFYAVEAFGKACLPYGFAVACKKKIRALVFILP